MIDPGNPDFTNTPISIDRPCFGYALADVTASPYVTVITPFYNTGPIFEETARSMFQQTFQQWEWLIINDGTTCRESISILGKYRSLDPRIRVIDHTTNMGPSAGRNTGFRTARSHYVVQLDSDDLLEPTALEKWCWFLESYPEFGFVKGYSVAFGAEEYLWQRGFHFGRSFLEENQVDQTCMFRKAVHEAVGGYDESMRNGLEDWEFWLRCASQGYWGGNVPEHLNWYRRRPDHRDRWPNWNEEGLRDFHSRARARYPRLWQHGFPEIEHGRSVPNDKIPDRLPCENRLLKLEQHPRLLMLMRRLTSKGADVFKLELVKKLRDKGWEVTVATTYNEDLSSLSQFSHCTPDIFVLPHFLRVVDYPRFLRYLMHSRQVETVIVAECELGYLLLPYLRSHFPHVTYVGLSHSEEPRKTEALPPDGVLYSELLDFNVVASEGLKTSMVKHGVAPHRIGVCDTLINIEKWSPDQHRRRLVRSDLGLDDTTPLILYAGRVYAENQPFIFARTILRLRESGTHFVALVAGDGPDLDWLYSFVEKHRLSDQIRILGVVSTERLRELMSAADIFFQPSQNQRKDVFVHQAMACGLPIVSLDIGNRCNLKGLKCGVLIPCSDEYTEMERYAEALTELLKNPQSCKEMGKAGRTWACNHYSLEHLGETMVLLLKKAKSCHADEPRPDVGLEVRRVSAAKAVEFSWFSQVPEMLLRGREESIQKQVQAIEVLLEERQRVVAEQQTRAAKLEQERDKWQRVVAEQQTRAAELEQERDKWQRLAEERESLIANVRKTVWVRLGVLLRLVRNLRPVPRD